MITLNTLALYLHCQYADYISVHLIHLNELIPVIEQSQDITSYVRHDPKDSSVPNIENAQHFLFCTNSD